MQIGIDARYLGAAHSGLARYSENLLEALARLDHDNRYTVYVHSTLKRKLNLGDNFRLVPIRGRPHSIRSMRRLAVAVRREPLDLFHVHFPYAPRRIKCPVLLTVHDLLPFTREQSEFARGGAMARWFSSWVLYPLALRRAKWIICVSRATRDGLARLFPDTFHKGIVVPSGISEAFRSPIETATHELIRSRLNLPGRYLLYSGSARADKNVEGMLRAFARLRQNHPSLESYHFILDISGRQYSLRPIMRAIERFELYGNVRIIRDAGDEERRVLFEEAELFVVFSRTEGFGLPILEAQLCGVPVVAADYGALPEVAGEHGALFVDPDNLEESVRVVERALTDSELRAYLVGQGLENAQRYEWGRTAQRVLEIYQLLFHPRGQLDPPQRTRWLQNLIGSPGTG